MPIPGKQFEAAMRQGVSENFLLLGSDLAFVAAQQQHRNFDLYEQGPDIDGFKTLMQSGRNVRASFVHFGDHPFAQRRASMLQVEPVAERVATPFADPVRPDSRRSVLLTESVDPSDLIRNP